MLKRRTVMIAIAFLGASISATMSAPVTSEDLTGKTICWQNTSFGPSVTHFGEGGKYSTSGAPILRGPDGEGTWAVTSDGVKIDTEVRHHIDKMEKLPDGTFLSDMTSDHIKSTGRYCQ